VVVAQPVGVVGERGLLRQHRQAGEQGAGRVGEQVVDVGDPPGGGELEGEQGQDPADRRDGRGARVAGPGDQGRQVEGDQVGDGQQQPGQAGPGAGGERTEVDDARGGQAGVAAGGGRAGAGLGRGTAQQPAEALLREDLPDAGAVQAGSLRGQPGADLIDRQALAAQLDDPRTGGVLPRCALRAGHAGQGEHLHPSGAEVAQQAGHARPRVAGPGAGLGDADPLHEVRAQRLVPALARLGGRGKELRAGGRFRCHVPGLSDAVRGRAAARIRARCSGPGLISLGQMA